MGGMGGIDRGGMYNGRVYIRVVWGGMYWRVEYRVVYVGREAKKITRV